MEHKMKTAVIYYSYSGNCNLIAQMIKSAIKADLFEIKTVDSKRRKGFFLILWGGFQAVTKKKPALKPLPVDFNSYDCIILGTPVWAGSPAPALVSFLSQNQISGRKLALFCCHGGGMGKVFGKIKAMLQGGAQDERGNAVIGEIDFKDPVKGDAAESKNKIEEWLKNLGLKK